MFGKSDKTRVTELESEIKTLASSRDEMFAQLETFKSEVESFADVKRTLNKKISEYKSEIENMKQMHDTELKCMETSVNRKINAALSSIGVSAFASEIIKSDKDQSDVEALRVFNSLSGQEKTDFYNKNKAKISRALLSK